MFAHGQTVIQLMDALAPKQYAVEGDKIGLQVGTLQKEIRKVLVALDVTEEVVDEAIALDANLIIAHHAVIYRPLAKLDTGTPAGRLYEKLIKHDIAVYIAHTNLDSAEGGINDQMAELLELTGRDILEEVYVDKLYKLVVYVPEESRDRLLEAVWGAGAGQIGAYGRCSFSADGVGTFQPGEGTAPFVGTPGRLERVPEVRVETVVPASAQRKVVQAMKKAHPYEEPAFDLIRLELPGRAYGLGRVGRLPEAEPLERFAERVKRAFQVPAVRIVGPADKAVRKVAVLGGSGGRYVRHALFAGADVLVTGDIDYHTAQDALAAGLAIVDPGHNIEKIMKRSVAERLNEGFRTAGSATTAVASGVNTEVFRFQ